LKGYIPTLHINSFPRFDKSAIVNLPAASRGASLFFLPLDGGGLRWGWGVYGSSPSPNPSRQGRGIRRMPFIPVASHGDEWHPSRELPEILSLMIDGSELIA